MKGRRSSFPDGDQLQKVIRLLRDTDLSCSTIAIRFGTSASTIIQLNRRLGIRRSLKGGVL